jgi:hypothetical protein
MGNCRSEPKTEFEYTIAKQKHGKARIIRHYLITPGLFFFREFTYQALKLAEKEKGGPVNIADVTRAYRKLTKLPLFSPYMLWFNMHELYWDDKILADREVNRWTLNPAL